MSFSSVLSHWWPLLQSESITSFRLDWGHFWRLPCKVYDIIHSQVASTGLSRPLCSIISHLSGLALSDETRYAPNHCLRHKCNLWQAQNTDEFIVLTELRSTLLARIPRRFVQNGGASSTLNSCLLVVLRKLSTRPSLNCQPTTITPDLGFPSLLDFVLEHFILAHSCAYAPLHPWYTCFPMVEHALNPRHARPRSRSSAQQRTAPDAAAHDDDTGNKHAGLQCRSNFLSIVSNWTACVLKARPIV